MGEAGHITTHHGTGDISSYCWYIRVVGDHGGGAWAAGQGSCSAAIRVTNRTTGKYLPAPLLSDVNYITYCAVC